MAKAYEPDEFDSVPQHGGTHRARRTKTDRVVEFLAVMGVSALVAVGGYFGLKAIDAQSILPVSLPNVVPTSSSTVDVKKSPVSVFDATEADGQASAAATILLNDGWNIAAAASVTPKDGVVPAETIVYIPNLDLAPVAKAVEKSLGGDYPIQVSANFQDPVTVVLGSDVHFSAPSASPSPSASK